MREHSVGETLSDWWETEALRWRDERDAYRDRLADAEREVDEWRNRHGLMQADRDNLGLRLEKAEAALRERL